MTASAVDTGEQTDAPARARLRVSARALEAFAVLGLVGLALAVRWPELATIPRFTDETYDLMPAVRIARGQELPLTSYQPYIGALFGYLVAGAYLLLGPELATGRLVALVGGALTVVATYLLGRSVGGRTVGLLAGLLLAVSPTHTVVSSHLAYSHSLTPLFSTLGLWLLHEAMRLRSGPRLAGAGLAFGLALQTHPTAAATWPGLAACLVWKGRPLPRRWAVVAALGLVAAVTNLLVYNAASGSRGLETTSFRTREYVGVLHDPLGPGEWLGRWPPLLREVTAGLGGLVSELPQPDAWLHPIVAVYAGLALAGLILLASASGGWLLPLAVASGLLAFSLHGSVEPVVAKARHYALLLPIGYVAVAVALQAVCRPLPRRPAALLAAGAAVLLLLAAPLVQLRQYYAAAHHEGNTNLPLLQTLEAVERAGPRGEAVLLDETLYLGRTLSGGRLLDQLRLAFELRGQAFTVVDVERGRLLALELSPAGRRVVLHAQSVEPFAARYRLEPLAGEPGPEAPLRAFRAYPPG